MHHCVEYTLKLLKSQQIILFEICSFRFVCKNKHLIYIICKSKMNTFLFNFLNKTLDS